MMMIRQNQFLRWAFSASSGIAFAVFSLAPAHCVMAAENPAATMVPLRLDLPAPKFGGTPTNNITTNSYTEPYPDPDKPRPLIMVPAGLKNVAKGSKVTCSDKSRTEDMLAKVIDGDKEPSEESIIYLRKGSQWVEQDLGSPQEIFAIVLWHAHNAVKIFYDVVVQIADDEDFTKNVQTVFNNDQDNSSGLGIGTDREYYETHEGKLIPVKGVKGRYVRCYSRGSSESVMSEYTEIEVYGRSAK
jgi:hypothetical protein